MASKALLWKVANTAGEWVKEPVVESGKIITAGDFKDAKMFAQTLLRALKKGK